MNYSEEIKNGIVIVKFYLPSCGPCKLLTTNVWPKLLETNPNIKFLNINAYDYPELPKQLNINNVPVVIVYKDGKEMGRIVGLKLQKDYQELINNAQL